VEIKYHKVILGDNPAVTDGAPITIHWKDHYREVLDIESFERKNPESCRIRKRHSTSSIPSSSSNSTSANPSSSRRSSSALSRKDLRIDVQDRAALLLKNGYSIQDIGRKVQEVQEIQKERSKSAANGSKWDNLNVALETSGKVFKQMIRLDKVILGNNRNSAASNSHNPTTPAA
jgi:hypothetical protein